MSLSAEDIEQFAEGAARAAALLKAVGNEHRLLVLCLLVAHGELTVGELLQRIPLSQSALSQHLARMREEGLVAFRRESQTLYYRIADPRVERLLGTLKEMFCPDTTGGNVDVSEIRFAAGGQAIAGRRGCTGGYPRCG